VTRVLTIAIIAVAVGGVGVALWINAGGKIQPIGPDFLAVDEVQTVRSGQQMQPRWNDDEGVADDPTR
jgi:hypothetical protein